MRLFAIIPTLLSAAALVMAFLCLFAGHKENFMEDFHLFTLNTSRIGTTVGEQLASDFLNGGDTPIPLPSLPASITNIINSLPPDLQSVIESVAGTAADSFANDIGLEDFYSAHLLDYCYGDYTPNPIPNATVSADDISKDVQGCSDPSASFWFDPRAVLQESLDRNNFTAITVDELLQRLNFPDQILTGLEALRVAYRAMFACYIITIGLSFIMFVTSLIYMFTHGSRITACITIIISIITFLASGAASGVATAVNVIGANAINEYGDQVGVEATMGRPFLALTWASTAAVLLGMFYWFVDCCCGRSKKTKYSTYGEK